MKFAGQTSIKGLIAVVVAIAAGAIVAQRNMAAAPPPAKSTKADSRPRVEVVHPRRVTVAQRLQTNATLEAFETADLFAKVTGHLSDVRVDIGDHVKAGQVLAVIDIPELQQQLAEDKAQLASKQSALETARRPVDHDRANRALQDITLKRNEVLFQDQWVSAQMVDQNRADAAVAKANVGIAKANRILAVRQIDLAAATVEKTKALLSYTQIVAPFDGVVARRLVNRGDLVQPPTGTLMKALFTVQRIDTIRVFCDVPENDVPYLHIGDPAIVKPFGLNGERFIGKVTRFSLRLDPDTRNMRTEIDLPNPEERLYPGMYAAVSLEMNRHPDALTVPTAAVGSDGGGSFVDTITDNRITRIAIKTGLTDNGQVEVTAGLSEETPVMATIKSAPPLGAAVQPPTARESSQRLEVASHSTTGLLPLQ
jgi:RND family efflux transporter MFP subunit